MALIQFEQHLEESVVALAPPWWGKPRIAALLASYIRRLQDVEDDLWEILTSRELDNADLVRLKVLGEIVGQDRLTFAEDEYREVIRARALANVSRGRASDLLAVLDVIVGTGAYTLTEMGNATLFLTILTDLEAWQELALRVVLPDTRAAGVGFQLLIGDAADPDDVFVWGDTWATTETWAGAFVI
jgi:hypothetical protein